MKVNPLCDYCLKGFYITEDHCPVCLTKTCRASSDFAHRPEGEALRVAGAIWMIEPEKFTGPGRFYPKA